MCVKKKKNVNRTNKKRTLFNKSLFNFIVSIFSIHDVKNVKKKRNPRFVPPDTFLRKISSFG